MKRILLLLLLFVSAITFSDTLKNISYNNGKVIGTFRENKQIMPNASVTKLGNEDILMLSFPNSEMESNVQAFINQNDQYISKVYTTQRNGMVVVYVYLKPSVTYQVVSRTGQFQVTLDGGKQHQEIIIHKHQDIIQQHKVNQLLIHKQHKRKHKDSQILILPLEIKSIRLL